MRDLQQIRGVLARRRTHREHAIVTGELALDAEPARRPPDAWMRTVQRTCQRRQALGETVGAGHMRQLVQDHRAAPVGGPSARGRGQHDRRAERSESERHHLVVHLKDADRTSDAQPPRRIVHDGEPAGRVNHPRPPRQPRQRELLAGQPDKKERDARRIERDAERERIERWPARRGR